MLLWNCNELICINAGSLGQIHTYVLQVPTLSVTSWVTKRNSGYVVLLYQCTVQLKVENSFHVKTEAPDNQINWLPVCVFFGPGAHDIHFPAKRVLNNEWSDNSTHFHCVMVHPSCLRAQRLIKPLFCTVKSVVAFLKTTLLCCASSRFPTVIPCHISCWWMTVLDAALSVG